MALSVSRRTLLRWSARMGAMGAAVLALPKALWAEWNKSAFEAKTPPDLFAALGGLSPIPSPDVRVVTSDIAENGAVVPVQAVSTMPGTDRLMIVVDKNPNSLAAQFDIAPNVVPEITARIKMAQTANIIVLARAGGAYYMASKEVKVTIGGCGG